MKKEKLTIEYHFGKTSTTVLWNMIGTPAGLASWFADDVSEIGSTYTFFWHKTGQQADLLHLRPMNSIRFHWQEEEGAKTYFEFKLIESEVTQELTLIITDFAETEESADAIDLWNSQIDVLRRKIGR